MALSKEALREEKEKLQDALGKVKTLTGLLPICASCKKIRDDKGYWNQIESYIKSHSEAEFTHSICPDCAEKLYPELSKGSDSDADGQHFAYDIQLQKKGIVQDRRTGIARRSGMDGCVLTVV